MTNLMVIFKNLINKEFAVYKYNLKFMVRLFEYIGNLLFTPGLSGF